MAAGERTIRIKIDGDGKGLIVTVKTVEKEIERIGRVVDNVNRRLAAGAVRLAKFAAGAAAIANSVGGVTALGSTLATATGVLLGLPAAAAAGGAALGTITLGAAGIEKAFKGVNATLLPLKARVSSTFERGLKPAVADINRLLPTTERGFTGIAREMSGVVQNAAATAALPKNQSILNQVLSRTSGLMSGVRRAAGPLTAALFNVTEVGSQRFGSMGDRIAASSRRLAAFIARARETGELRRRLDGGVEALRELWQMLRDIGAIVKGTFSGISEGAGGVASSIRPAIQRMREFVESTRGQEFLNRVGAALSEIGEAVGGVVAAGLAVAGPLAATFAQTLAVLSSTAAGILVPALSVLAPILQVIADFMARNENLVRVLVSTLGGLAVAYLTVHGAIKLVNQATTLWGTVSDLASNRTAALGTSFSTMGKAAKIASLSMGAIGVIATLIGTALSIFSGHTSEAEERQEALAAASKSVAKVLDEENEQLNKRTRAAAAAALEESGLLKVVEDHALSTRDLTDAYLGNNDARIRLNQAIRDHIARLNEEEDAALAAGDANTGARLEREIESYRGLLTEIDGAIGGRQQESAAIDRQHRATEGATSATQSATAALEDQVAVLKELIDAQREAAGVVLDQREAERQLVETFNAATNAVKENGKGIDINTEAGRKNNEILDKLASDTFDLIDAQAKNNASNTQLAATMERSRQKFIATAIQMGYTESQAIDLANKLKLIPTQVQTRVSLNDAYARRRAKEFADLIRNMPSEKLINLRVSTRGSGHHLAGMATGGPPLPGRSYLVGERGPEILTMPNSIGGRIFSNAQSREMLSSGDVTVFVTIDGEQLQGRIDKTVKENNRATRRAAMAGTGGAR